MGPPYPLGIARFDPRKKNQKKNNLERRFKVRNFRTMTATQSQKAAEENQNKENKNETRGFILLQTQLTFFPASRNKQVFILNKAVIFLLNNTSFIDQA